ncbi:molecular chaperone Hsp33 [Rhodospirillum rubrum]|uniref:Hsp33 family molecular chaperone HslO n=1 Tax=Rhodospirillum rubrum TaxID=1085 RepID=UPI0019079ABD|nr:Hsp33 family molecular chaperone HslO [Rhodospirillum rubrum]MBK1666077.1 molecular chaperone Hsp33 [Rhodospirillum rubrum]MBK1678203.1 molecular chaperone Hsp33 [Rhodospirillum rubrum]
MSGPSDNLILPFHLASGVFRGRLVRAGRAVADTLRPHDYPPAVASLLAETLVLAMGLASGLKYDGVFTVQVRGEGAVRALVADVTSGGMVRGVARFDAERLPGGPITAPVLELLGAGHLTFTVDQGANTERYQGIVSLEGDFLADCVASYFDQSEQLPTALKVAVAPPDPALGSDAPWAATALMLQRMPPEGGRARGEAWDDAWQTATILMESLTPTELLDPALSPETLLHRPFHGEGLEVAPYRPVFFGCRCSRRKVARTLATFPREELVSLAHNGTIDVTCEFCKATYALSVQELDALAAEAGEPENGA